MQEGGLRSAHNTSFHADISSACASPLLERNAGTRGRTPLTDEGPKARARRERRRRIWEAKSQRATSEIKDCVVNGAAATAVVVAGGGTTRKRKRDGNEAVVAAKRRACDDGSGVPRAQHERAVTQLERERDEARLQAAQAQASQRRLGKRLQNEIDAAVRQATQRLKHERDAAVRQATKAMEELQQFQLAIQAAQMEKERLARVEQAAISATRLRSEYAQRCHEEQQEVIRNVRRGQVPGKKRKKGTRKQRRRWRRLNEHR